MKNTTLLWAAHAALTREHEEVKAAETEACQQYQAAAARMAEAKIRLSDTADALHAINRLLQNARVEKEHAA